MAAGDITRVYTHKTGKLREEGWDVITQNGTPAVLRVGMHRVLSAVATWTQTGTGTETVQCVIDNTTAVGAPTVSVTASSTGEFTCNVVIKGF